MQLKTRHSKASERPAPTDRPSVRAWAVLRRAALAVFLIATGVAPVWAAPQPIAAVALASCDLTGGTGSLTGQVTASGAPLNGAAMTLYREDGRYIGGTASSGSAAYSFSNLRAGRYILNTRPPANGNRLAPEWYTDQVDPLRATAITIVEGVTTTANVQLSIGSIIVGRVLKPHDIPLASATIQITDAHNEWVAQGTTNAAGVFTTTPGLTAGTYKLQVMPPETVAVVGEYYSDTRDPGAATPIVIVGIAQTVDVGVIALGASAQVAGQVTQAETGAPALASVWMMGVDSFASTTTNGLGQYSFTSDLSAGQYTLAFQPLNAGDNLAPASQVIALAAGETRTAVDVALQKGGTITGRVTDPNGQPLSGVSVSASDPRTGLSPAGQPTDAAGHYALTGLPTGAYAITFFQDERAVETYNDHPYGAPPDLVAVVAPNTVANIDAVLSPLGAISGTVTAADTGQPLAYVRVDARGVGTRANATAYTDSAGHYGVSGLRPGPYKLSFTPRATGPGCGYQPEWYADQTTESAATPVTVTAPGVVTGVDATLMRGSVISGRIVDDATGSPLRYASATVYDQTGNPVASGSTNFLGYYAASPTLPSGAYRIKLSDGGSGYVEEYYSNALDANAATSVSVTAPTDVSGIDAALALGGSISGHVTAGDTGLGLFNIQVTVYDLAGRLWSDTATELDGSYRISDGLPTGEYVVTFEQVGGSTMPPLPGPQAQSAATPPGLKPTAPWPFNLDPTLARDFLMLAGAAQAVFEAPYAPQVYDRRPTLAQADHVSVTAPNNSPGVDAVLWHGVFLPSIRR